MVLLVQREDVSMAPAPKEIDHVITPSTSGYRALSGKPHIPAVAARIEGSLLSSVLLTAQKVRGRAEWTAFASAGIHERH